MMLLITPDGKRASELAEACGSALPHHHIDDAAPNPEQIGTVIAENDVDVVVIGPRLETDVALHLTSYVSASFPFVAVVQFTRQNAGAVRNAMRAGATDVVPTKASTPEVVDAIRWARDKMHTHRGRSAEARSGGDESPSRVITVVSPRGGVGRTLVATTLAASLERSAPGEVVLVDLDLQCGDAAATIGLTPHLTIAALAGHHSLEAADVKALLAQDGDGPRVLAAPHSLASSVGVEPELVSMVLSVLATSFRYVVIDSGTAITETTLAAFDATTDIVLVCAPDVPSVRALGRATDALDELKITSARRHLVVNKATARYGMPLKDIESVSGMKSSAQIPASKEVAVALNRGSAFDEVSHPRGVVSRSLASLVDDLGPAQNAGQRRGFLGLSR